MAAFSRTFWQTRSHQWLTGIIVLLLIVIGIESSLLYSQMRVNQQINAVSEKYLERFEKNARSAPSDQVGTDLLFKNVEFIWSNRIFVKTPDLTATLEPLKAGAAINFDLPQTFLAHIHQGDVYIRPDVLEGMFNESVFNYPNSKLRDLKVSIMPQSGKDFVDLKGSLNFIFWIPFEMLTDLSIDHSTNTLVISVHNLKIFGFIPITPLIKFDPFHLEKMLTVPENKYLTVHANNIYVKPFGLFPPPRVDGKMSEILVTPSLIRLSFRGGEDVRFEGIPFINAPSYIYLQGGTTRFGLMGMVNTRIQVLNKKHQNLFPFALGNYLDKLPQSTIKLNEDNSVTVEMPPVPVHRS